jgi:hypothetical protein
MNASRTCNFMTQVEEVKIQTGTLCCKLVVNLLIGALGSGIRCDDNAAGPGYIMYTLKSSYERFSAGSNDAEHFVCVRFNQELNRWIYAGDGGAYADQPFTLMSSDLLIAQFEFGNATSTLSYINSAAAGNTGISSFEEMRSGYVSKDITLHADTYNGTHD